MSKIISRTSSACLSASWGSFTAQRPALTLIPKIFIPSSRLIYDIFRPFLVPWNWKRPKSCVVRMQDECDLSFVIPTNRLREVGETVEQYDEHFWRNGHSPQIIVFDDSTPANQEKYFPLLAQTKTHYDVSTSALGKRNSFFRISMTGCATKGSSRWSRTCSGPATAAIAIIR